MPITATRQNSAGSSRLARRAQNAPSAIVADRCHSATSSDVIRNPDRTKNTSTPRNPPGAHDTPPWYSRTASHRDSAQAVETGVMRQLDTTETIGWFPAHQTIW